MNSVLEFDKMKKEGRKISMVTTYDYWTAKLAAQSNVDCLLVGDSLAMVMHGFDSTIYATVEMMALHTAAVRRGVNQGPAKFVVTDMPFMSFRKGIEASVTAVESLMRAGAQAVKVEGVSGHEEVIRHIVESGVPVMGHIGLTPQSINALGGFRVQGKDHEAARTLVDQAVKLQSLGCFSIVLECVPALLAQEITQRLTVPTIGIGAGIGVDGQVLVLQDLLGAQADFKPKFLKEFMDAAPQVMNALNTFDAEVKARLFPTEKESYS